MKKCQFSQVYALVYVIMIISCFSFFYSTVSLWKDKNLGMQEFSDLKNSVYRTLRTGRETSVFFNESVNLTCENNVLFFNYSRFHFSKKLRAVRLSDSDIIMQDRVIVFKEGDVVGFR